MAAAQKEGSTLQCTGATPAPHVSSVFQVVLPLPPAAHSAGHL
jgi:hypothetical protein